MIIVGYGLPATAVWALVGLVMNILPFSGLALVTLVIYALYYGMIEAADKRGLSPPGTRWQVPQTFVVSRSWWRKMLIWGALLGPGFATRNPYAGFGLLLLAVAVPHNMTAGVLIAAGVGALHGTARGLALIRDARRSADADYMQVVLRSMHWRMFDGFMLLAIASMTLVAGAYSI